MSKRSWHYDEPWRCKLDREYGRRKDRGIWMKAVLHPNGFLIRLLHTFSNGIRLRIHTWPRGERRLDSPHDHRSWFVSIPLWGKFIERRFEGGGGKSRYDVLRCHSTSSNGIPVTSPDGFGSLTEVSRQKRYPLIPYLCPAGAIHSLVPEKPGFAATIVLFGPPRTIPRVWLSRLP